MRVPLGRWTELERRGVHVECGLAEEVLHVVVELGSSGEERVTNLCGLIGGGVGREVVFGYVVAESNCAKSFLGGGGGLEEGGILVVHVVLDDPSGYGLEIAEVGLGGLGLRSRIGLLTLEVKCSPFDVVQDEELEPSNARRARSSGFDMEKAEEGPNVHARDGVVIVKVPGPEVARVDLERPALLLLRVVQCAGYVLHLVGFALYCLVYALLLFT